MKRLLTLAALIVGSAALAGCGGDEDGGPSEEEIRGALEELPFEFVYRDVAYSGGTAVAGVATESRHRTYFAITDGKPDVKGRLVPRQRLPNGGFQKGKDVRSISGTGVVLSFVYTQTSTPRASEEIDTAICELATGDTEGCRGL